MEGMDAAGVGDDNAGHKREPSSPPDGQPAKQRTGSSTMTSTGVHRRKRSLDDAMEYLMTLKKNLDPGTYEQFLQTMMDFASKRDRVKCVKRVKELLKEHPDLSVGFENFLPADWGVVKVSSPEKDPDYNDALSLVIKIKNRLPENDYKTFLKILAMYRSHRISRREVYDKCVVLFKDRDDLLEQLRYFITNPDVAEGVHESFNRTSKVKVEGRQVNLDDSEGEKDLLGTSKVKIEGRPINLDDSEGSPDTTLPPPKESK